MTPDMPTKTQSRGSLERIVRPIAAEIVQALKQPMVFRWTTWDSWAGRQVHHERGMSEEEAVIEVLKRHWPNAPDQRPPK